LNGIFIVSEEKYHMLVSAKERCALRVLIDPAKHRTGDCVPLRAIAERPRICEKYLGAVLKLLMRGKIIAGLRGKGGGCGLAVAPEELRGAHSAVERSRAGNI